LGAKENYGYQMENSYRFSIGI